MYLGILFCIVLCLPHLNGNSISTSEKTQSLSSKAATESLPKVVNNTKAALITEGGTVEPEPPVATLPKENHVNLINLDKEIGKTEVKSVVPRKGVKYSPAEDVPAAVPVVDKERIDTTVSKTQPSNTSTAETPLPKSSTKSSLPSSIADIKDTKTPPTAQTKIPKKPLVLSAEAINETDRQFALLNAKEGTSVKPIVHDQLPSPKVKYEQLSTSHPGMVMPVVITMLVVPMFAVLGYMALRRGQEAWKNRHYKRMDFLLDGMYND